MDLTARKYKFIEDFIRMINSDQLTKLKELEELLYSDEITNSDVLPLSQDQIQYLDDIRKRHFSGDSESMSLEDFRKRFEDSYGISH
ncbi:hypothetical protein [Moheibacter stercoris]|uniref:Addiction module component, TIGR02574 family n=1 Tax=Moheibacter stercoris TaxID=1628251 RepID=A0ABV2LR45_9FLAO